MRIKDYFIWEKSYVNNRGMEIKFRLSPYCYLKPTMSASWCDWKTPKEMQKPMSQYLYCRNKIYFWLWFRLIIESEIKEYKEL